MARDRQRVALSRMRYWHIARLMKVTVVHSFGLAEHGLDRAFLGRGEIHALAGGDSRACGKAPRPPRRSRAPRSGRWRSARVRSSCGRSAAWRRRPSRSWWRRPRPCRRAPWPLPPVGEALAVGGRVVVEVVHLPLGAAQMVAEVAGALIEPAADRFEHAGLFRRRHRCGSGAAAGGGGAASCGEGQRRRQHQPARDEAGRRGGHAPRSRLDPGPGTLMAIGPPMPQCDGEIETRLRTSIAQPRCRRRARRR